MVTVGGAGGQQHQRSCVTCLDGGRFFEPPVFSIAGERCHLVLHMACGLGAIGFPAANWLIHKAGLRGSLIFDLLHRRVSDWSLAISHVGLRLLVAEFKQVVKMRAARFRTSANHIVVLQAAGDMLDNTTWETNTFFNMLYLDISAEFELDSAEEGPPQHMESVWRAMSAALLQARRGDNTTSSWWWNFEQNSGSSCASKAAYCVCVVLVGDAQEVVVWVRVVPFERCPHEGH